MLFKHDKYSETFWFVWRTIEFECAFLSRMTTSKMGRRTRRLMKVSQRTVNFAQLATFFGARARLTIQNCFKRLLCSSYLAWIINAKCGLSTQGILSSVVHVAKASGCFNCCSYPRSSSRRRVLNRGVAACVRWEKRWWFTGKARLHSSVGSISLKRWL